MSSQESKLRLNAQLIIASVIGGQSISAASWAANVATITIGAHSLIVGQKVVIFGVNPTGYNGLATVTGITATTFTFALIVNPGSYVGSGKVTAQCQLGMTEQPVNSQFWANLAPAVSATTGPAATVLMAYDDNIEGQSQHYSLFFKVCLWQGQAQNTSNDGIAMETVWTGVRDALMLQSNWSSVTPILPPPDSMTVTMEQAPRTDGLQQVNVWQWMYTLKFWGSLQNRN